MNKPTFQLKPLGAALRLQTTQKNHAAVARCLADVIHSQSGTKVFIEQEIPALTRVVNGQSEHARMDLVFNLNGTITYLDVSVVAPFSCNPSQVSAASTRPGHKAKGAQKSKFDRYPHINLVPFILETTSRPGPHARKFISYLLQDADNPPPAIKTLGPPFKVCSTVPSLNNNSRSQGVMVNPNLSCADFVLTHASTVLTGTHTAFPVSSLPQPSYVVLL